MISMISKVPKKRYLEDCLKNSFKSAECFLWFPSVEMKSPVPPFVSVKISSTFLLSSQEGILAGHAVGTEGYFAAEKIAVGRHFPFVISQW